MCMRRPASDGAVLHMEGAKGPLWPKKLVSVSQNFRILSLNENFEVTVNLDPRTQFKVPDSSYVFQIIFKNSDKLKL